MRLLILIFILFLNTLVKAQRTNSEVKNTWLFYNEVQDKIKKGEYFVDKFSMNTLKSNWNKDFLIRKKETYFYDVNQGDSISLNYLTLAIDSISTHYQIEFLFNAKGELIYCVERQDNPKYHYRHLSIFLQNDKVSQLREGNVIIKSSLMLYQQRIAFLKASGKYYYQKFKDYINSTSFDDKAK